ncbi:MAG: ABC transporter permease [Bacteroidota bacterium]
MFDLEKWQEIFHILGKNRLRVILTGIGVFWGIFMLVILMGASSGLENGVNSTISANRNAVFMWTNETSLPYKGFLPGREPDLTLEDYEAIKREIPEVDALSPRVVARRNIIMQRGTKSSSFSIFGDYPDINQVMAMDMTDGRFLNMDDIKEYRKVCVIGKRVQEVLFEPEEEPVGDYIQINGIHFKVIGVFDSPMRGEAARDAVQTIYIPTTAFQKVFNLGNSIYWFAMTPKPGKSSFTLEEKAKVLLSTRHNIHPEDPSAIRSNNLEENFQEGEMILGSIRAFGWLVSIMTIIAGMVGLANIMMITVKDRTKELGIRKAMGATPASIVSMIISEALFLTLVAGYLGLISGIGVVNFFDSLTQDAGIDMFYHPEISFSTVMWAMGVLLTTGCLAGLIPALKAARMKPTYALKDD